MRLWYRACRVLCCWVMLWVFRGRVFGAHRVPRQGGVLLVCNHQSFLDPVVATYALPRECHYMARDSLWSSRPLAWLMNSLNAFPIRRGSADLTAIKETLRRLKSGALVTAFPEGTRTPDGRVLPMEAGVVVLARRAGVPIVPTMIVGAFEAWPRQHRLPHPAPIVVYYGQPLTPQRLAAMDDEAGAELIRSRIVEMMERARRMPWLKPHLAPLPSDDRPLVHPLKGVVAPAAAPGGEKVNGRRSGLR